VSGLYASHRQTSYGAAKGGIASFTLMASQELAREGVTVNAVAPGALTRLTEDLDMPDKGKARYDPAWVGVVVPSWPRPPRPPRPDQRPDHRVIGRFARHRRGMAPWPADAGPPSDRTTSTRRSRNLLAGARPRTTMADVADA